MMTERKPWWDFEPQDLRELGLKVLTNRSIDTSRVFFQSVKFLFLGLLLLLGSRDLSRITVAASWEELLRLLCVLISIVAVGYITSGIIVLVAGYLWLNLLSQWACLFAFDAIARYLLGMISFAEALTNLVRAVLVTGAFDLVFRLWESRRRDVPIRWRLEVFCRVVGLASALVWTAWFWRFSFAPKGGGNSVSASISVSSASISPAACSSLLWLYRSGDSELGCFWPYPDVNSLADKLALISISAVFGVVTTYQVRSGKGYAARHLSFPDYLDEEQTIVGLFLGRIAERLRIAGVVEEGDVDKLIAGRHPRTGDVLRERAGTKNSVAANDFVVSAPKSVSIMSRVDDRIEPLFAEAARATVVEFLQSYVDTRVRVNGANELRETGELLAAAYLHDTSRALDPQLHVHFVIPNMTWDEVEGQFKAMHAKRMYEALPLATEHFRSALAEGLKQLGYEIEPNFDKNGKSLGFEIKGIPESLREKFSQRSKDRDKGVEALEAEKGRELTGSEVAVVVRGTRQPKLTKISKAEVHALQQARMTEQERVLLHRVRDEALARMEARKMAAREAVEKVEERTASLEPERVQQGKVRGVEPERVQAAVGGRLAASWDKAVELWKGLADRHTVLSLEYAKEHVFERLSVAKVDEVIAAAMDHGRGKTSYEKLERLLNAQIERGDVVRLEGLIATKETLLREQSMIDNINRGVGRHAPLTWPGIAQRPMMAEEQAAIDSVLNSTDRVVSIQGAAGTRTAVVLAAIQDAIRSSGKEVTTVTPTGASMDVLKRAGVKDAIAMGRFALLNQRSWMEVPTEKAQQRRGHVVLVDQASLISSKQMAEFLDLTERLDCRVVLMGDTRQMRSVEAGDAFRLLQKDSELKTFRVTEVVQQRGSLRSALSTLREDPTLGFMKLSRMGVIDEVPEGDLFKAAAEEYVSLLGKR